MKIEILNSEYSMGEYIEYMYMNDIQLPSAFPILKSSKKKKEASSIFSLVQSFPVNLVAHTTECKTNWLQKTKKKYLFKKSWHNTL